MAISVDDVYQKVLAVANKEQRGYITPQEFNLFADHSQKEIFEQYFYDLNQFNRIPGNSMGHSDMKDVIESKISAFEIWTDIANTIFDTAGNIDLGQFSLYRIVEVMVDYSSNDNVAAPKEYKLVEEVTAKEYTKYSNSPLAKESEKRPVYIHDAFGFDRIKIIPPATGGVKINYIKKPSTPKWGYVVSQNSNTALWNPGASTDFELHPSEESELVYKILKLAGISMVRDDIMRAGQGMESVQIQQEKQ